MFICNFLDFCHRALFIRGMNMGKSFPNIKGRTSNKKAAGLKYFRPRTVTAAIIRNIRVFKKSFIHRTTHVGPAGGQLPLRVTGAFGPYLASTFIM